MFPVKQILICGFRGIPSLLPINLEEGDKVKSLILYGGNGTGKSSITDAWEWVTSGKIAHLAREGAEESAYPHISAKNTYVEIQFSDESVGTVRLTWDPKRMRTPTITGNLDAVRELIAHPCHVRHADLTRFVLFTKAERYEALASLMGFVPQLEYQTSLRRIESYLEQDLKQQRIIHGEFLRRHKEHFQNAEGPSFTAIELLAHRCVANGHPCQPEIDQIKEAAALLKKSVLKDPNARKLTAIRELRVKVSQATPPTGIADKVKTLRQACGSLKASQAENRQKLLLIPLLQAAGEFLASAPATGTCPLCNQKFIGDLKHHVASELSTLRLLKSLQDKVQTAKESIRIALSQSFFSSPLVLSPELKQLAALEDSLKLFNTKTADLKVALVKGKDLLAFDANNITEENLLSFDLARDGIEKDQSHFQDSKTALEQATDAVAKSLEDDTKRKKLVEDEAFVSAGITMIEELETSLNKGLRLRAISERLSVLVGRYVQKALEDVTMRFARISEKVRVFFALFEKDTPGLGAPILKLDVSQDKSVVLEVEFHGKPISPAYKYLSESQLNSFGLSVALASATEFNPEFPFLILDDVVNSCDVDKRGKLIDLIQNHLSHVQIILLTHDRIWRDLLHRRLATWKRLSFQRYEIGIGPICVAGEDFYEGVERLLKTDEVENATGTLARYLENEAQEMCEAFEVEMKFNRRNEFTLDPLLTAIRTRLQKKLGATHPAVAEITRITSDNAYRNWGVHSKNPEACLQAPEIRGLVAKWRSFEEKVYCQQPQCGKIVTADGAEFRCKCGATELKREGT
jgi:hypothetical protein